MSACLQAYRSDPVVSDLFSNMLNDGAISAVHSFKTRGGKWALRTCKRSEYVKFRNGHTVCMLGLRQASFVLVPACW